MAGQILITTLISCLAVSVLLNLVQWQALWEATKNNKKLESVLDWLFRSEVLAPSGQYGEGWNAHRREMLRTVNEALAKEIENE